MLAIHTILHPTDFSENSEYAFRLACALARDYSARLIVVHAVAMRAIPIGEGIVLPTEEEVRAARRQLDELRMPRTDVRAERRLVEGDAVTEILHVAQEIKADLIVMGTHGRTGLSRLLMGSVAEQVVRQAACPVLTVRIPSPEMALAANSPGEEVVRAG